MEMVKIELKNLEELVLKLEEYQAMNMNLKLDVKLHKDTERLILKTIKDFGMPLGEIEIPEDILNA